MPRMMAGATEELQEIAPVFEPPPATAPAAKRPRRRLSDALIRAFDAACIEEELDAAAELIDMLDSILARRSPDFVGTERRTLEMAHSLHKRLWHLRHAGLPQSLPRPSPTVQSLPIRPELVRPGLVRPGLIRSEPVPVPTDPQPQPVR